MKVVGQRGRRGGGGGEKVVAFVVEDAVLMSKQEGALQTTLPWVDLSAGCREAGTTMGHYLVRHERCRQEVHYCEGQRILPELRGFDCLSNDTVVGLF